MADDAATGSDLLALTTDVETAAKLLTAMSTTPPLSIALMGHWGSGKTKFLQLLRDRITSPVAGSAELGVYVQQVRVVEFNAWHYNDDHLWVGLIEQLFRQLRHDPTATDPTGQQEAEDLATVQAQLGQARTRQERLDRQLSDLEELDPDRGWFGRLAVLRRAMVAARAAGQDASTELRGRQLRSALWLAVPVVITVGVAVVFGAQLRDWALALPWIRDAAAALPWLVAAAGFIPAVRAAVRTVWDTARASGEELHTKLQKRREENAADLKKLQDAVVRLDPAQQLDALLTEISSEDRYATHRGLLGRVSADLHRLDAQLANQPDPAQRWRIILYIDDLDRCPADRVVEVLQAVNLLMSMRLFFVVVAVDPRWLFTALDQHHRHLLTTGEQDTDVAARALEGRALDYLDKIFQVPLALRPVGDRGEAFLRQLLPDPDPLDTDPLDTGSPAGAGLAGDSDSDDNGVERRPGSDEASSTPHVAQTGAPQPAPAGPPPAVPPSYRADTGNDAVRGSDSATATPTEPATGSATADSTGDRPPLRREAQELRLSHAEADFLPHLAPLLPTPRAMKKFTNLYRLLRLAITTDHQADYLGDRDTGGPYQAAALLLAILVGDPGHSRDLLEHLLAADPTSEITETLAAAETGLVAPGLHDMISRLRAAEIPIYSDVAGYQQWARAVARYSFETYQLYTGS